MSGFLFKGAKLEDLIYGTPSGTAASSTQITGSFKSTKYTFGAVSRSKHPIEFYESSKGVYQLGYSIQLADYTHDLAYFSTPNVTQYDTSTNTHTVPAYANHASFICIGGGGGGAGAGEAKNTQGSGAGGGGGGGGGGGYLSFRLLPVTPGDPYQVQIGSGGTAYVNGGNNAFPGVSGGAGGATTISQFGTGQFFFSANGGAGGTKGDIGGQQGQGGVGGEAGSTEQFSDVTIAPTGIRNNAVSVAGNAGKDRTGGNSTGGDGGTGGNSLYANEANTSIINLTQYGTGGNGGSSGNTNQEGARGYPTVGTQGYARIYWFRL